LWQRTYYPVLIALAAIGVLFFRRGSLGGGLGAALLVLSALYFAAIGYVYFASVTHLSMRYVGFPCLLLVPWAGYGLDRLIRRVEQAGGLLAARAALVVVILLLLPRAFRPRPEDEAPILDAAAWVRERSAGGPARLMSTREAAVYHAGARHVHAYTPEEMRRAVDRGEADFLIYEDLHLRQLTTAERDLLFGPPGLVFRARFGSDDVGVSVYELAAPR
jgi:hypothetical protein